MIAPLPTDFFQPPGPRAERAQGYMLSSYDLRCGLDVQALALSALPHEVQRELQRLRLCWGPAPTPDVSTSQALR